MLTSNLKSSPMKKQWEHLVVKLSTILWISAVFTSSPGFGIFSSGDTASTVKAEDSLLLLEGVVWRLEDGVGVPLSAGVAVVLVLRESAGTARGFLIVCGLDDPAPSSAVAFRLTGCCDFGLLCKALFRTVTACLSFTNLLATLVFETLPSINMASGFIASGSMQDSLTYCASNGCWIWCMNMWTFCSAEFSRMTSTWSPRAWTEVTSHPVTGAQVWLSSVPTFTTNSSLNCAVFTT